MDVECARGRWRVLGGEGDVSTASRVGGGRSRGSFGEHNDLAGEGLAEEDLDDFPAECLCADSTDSKRSKRGFLGSMERDTLEEFNSLGSAHMECLL